MDSNFLRYINHRLPAVFLFLVMTELQPFLDYSAILDPDLHELKCVGRSHKVRFSFTSMATLRKTLGSDVRECSPTTESIFIQKYRKASAAIPGQHFTDETYDNLKN